MSNTPDESSLQLFTEKTWLQGAIVTGVAYGVVLTLFIMCFYLLISSRTRSNSYRNIAFLIYITTMFIMGTLFMAACAEMTQLSFINNRNYSGGPAQYETDMFSIPVDDLGNVAYVIANWLADGLLVWRCFVIYKGSGISPWIVMSLPCLMFATSFVMGILFLIQVSVSSPWANGPINFTLPYATISLALNIIITIMIVVRLLLYRRRITKILGPGHGTQYTTIASMLVESAALYAVFALLFLIPFAMGSPITNISLQALSEIQIIAPFLIIFRVAQGKAWSTETSQLVTTDRTPPMPMSKLSRVTFTSNTTNSSTIETEDMFRGKVDSKGVPNSRFTSSTAV